MAQNLPAVAVVAARLAQPGPEFTAVLARLNSRACRRASCLRKRRCRSGPGQELPTTRWTHKDTPFYWITSSARSSSDGGIVKPSALAVLRLITNSNFVGCSIERSAGLGTWDFLHLGLHVTPCERPESLSLIPDDPIALAVVCLHDLRIEDTPFEGWLTIYDGVDDG